MNTIISRHRLASKRTMLAFLAIVALLGVVAGRGEASPGDTTRASVDTAGNQANDISGDASISADGSVVAFYSNASNLVSDDTNSVGDIFVRDRQTGATERVSVDSSGNQANNLSFEPSISADGRFVAFSSLASNLVPGDTGAYDIFVHDRQTGTTERVSVGSSGSQADGSSFKPSISADGRFVAFRFDGTNLVSDDTNGASDILVRDRQTGTTERVSVDSSGNQANMGSANPSISADGRFVAFLSDATNLVSGDTNNVGDIFVRDRQTGATERVSVDSSGNQANSFSNRPSISADGRFVAFQTASTTLVPNDSNNVNDVFVHDRQAGTTERVSMDSSGNQANGSSSGPSTSSDGRYVAFTSGASNMVPGDTNFSEDVFVRDLQTGTTERVNVDSSGNQANSNSFTPPSINGDGRFVAFDTAASNLVPGDTNERTDIFVHERASTGNQAPLATDDSYNVNEDSLLTVFLPPGVLSNDTDADGDILTAELVSTTSHGNLSLNADGTFNYRPNENFFGSDSFTYKATDGTDESNVATVSITVKPINDPPTISLPGPVTPYTENDPPTVIDPSAAVSDPDSPNFEGGRLSVGWLLTQPGAGTADDRLEIRNQGTAEGEIGVDGTNVTYGGTNIGSFTAGSGTRTLSITFNANATPAAVQELTRNITYRNVSDAPIGGARLVRFSLSDGDGGTSNPPDKFIPIFPVNDAPVAVDDTATTDEDTATDIDVVANDTDVDNAKSDLRVVSGSLSDPANGTVELTNEGKVRYTPDPDYNNTGGATADTLTYKVTDGTDESNIATVSITVNPVNDAPRISLPGPVMPYTENDPPTVIDSLATASDPDSPNFEGGRLSVAYLFPSIRTIDDRLEIRNQGTAEGEIGVDGTNVTYGGTNIGTFVGGSSTRFTLSITFNANATPAAVQELMRNITYRTVSDAPEGGLRLVRFSLSDGDGGTSNPADKFIPLIPVNDAPVNAVPGDQNTNEDTTLTFNSINNNLISVSDVDAGTNAVQVRLEAANGKLTLSGTSGLTFAPDDSGSGDNDMIFTGTIANINSALNGLTFDPDANYNGAAMLKITTNDQGNTGTGGALSDADTVNITVNVDNDAPFATDDSGYETNEDTELVIDNANTLAANDSAGPENESDQNLSVTEVFAGANTHGMVSLTDGKITYTPDENYNGPASFDYEVCDNGTTNGEPDSKCDTGTVSLMLNAVNDAPVATDDSYSVDEDHTLNIVAPGVLSNDTDVDSTNLTATNVVNSGPANGTLIFSADGSFTYTPDDDFLGTDSFSYKASDASAESNEVTVTITVRQVNDAPVATDDEAAIDEDATLVIEDTNGLAANDSAGPDNENGQNLSVTSVSNAQNGQVSLSQDGKITYTPDENYNGPASFDYEVCDNGTTNGEPDSKCDTGTVTVTVRPVNDAPVLDLNGNDDDLDYSTTFIEDGGAVGIVGSSGPGALAVSDVDDDNLDSATVTLTNHPDGSAESLSVNTSSAPSINTSGYNATTGILHLEGTATKVEYEQVLRTVEYNNTSQNPSTADRIVEFVVNDGELDSAKPKSTVTVIAVNAAPVANDDSYSVSEDTKLTVAAPGVLGNDEDVDNAKADLTSELVSTTSHGDLSLNADGSFSYTPSANYNGPDSFTYKANDGTDDSNVATVSITVRSANDAPAISLPGPALAYTENDPPTAIDPSATVSDPDSPNFAGGRLTLELTGTADGLLDIRNQGTAAGQIGFNGSEVTYGGTTIGFREFGTAGPTTLVIRFNPNATPAAVQELVRNITYVNGSDTPSEEPRQVRFTLSDGRGGTSSATKTINVIAVNDAPVANDDAAATDEDTATVIDVMANDTDVDNAMADLSVVSGSLSDPANGTAELNSEGKILYTPDANYNNTAANPDTFTYKVNDGTVDSNAATVSITVDPVNGAPTCADVTLTTDEDTQGSTSPDCSDVDGDSLTYAIDQQGAHGTASVVNGELKYDPDLNFNGTDTFTYKANDGTDDSNAARVSINVRAVNDAPEAQDGSGTTDEDTTSESFTLNASDVDDGDSLSYIIVSGPTHGTLNGTGNTRTYTPDANYSGSDSFTFKANDGTVDSNVATVSITVNPVNDAPVAAGDSYETNQDTTLNVATPGVLGNDTDADGDSLTAVLVSGPAHGTLTPNANGSFTYTPNANYNGSDSFTYRANDGKTASNVATVSITVKPVVDTTAPTVFSVNPSNNQPGVSPTTNIIVTFSEKMAEGTLNDNTVKLVIPGKKPTSIPVTMTKAIDNGRTVLTLNPFGSAKQNLAGNTTYQLTIEGAGDGDTFAVNDLAGIELAKDNVSSFTTAKK